MIVVVGRVALPCRPDAVVSHCLRKGTEVGIAVEGLLLSVGESVVAHVLFLACPSSGGEGVGLCCLYRNLSPLCCCHTVCSVNRHSALVEFLSVAQDVLAHFAEVYVEVASIERCVGLVAGVDERVEEPEFHILDVCRFEVVGVELAHHSRPFCPWVTECSVGVHLCGEVIWTALRRIVGEVEYGECGSGTVVGALVAVRV